MPYKRIRATTNPGGPGHGWVKAYFVSPNPGGYQLITDPDTGIKRTFIPSHLTDNIIGMKADPDYVRRLRGLGSATLVKALLEGDWNIVEGAFFDCWNSAQHIIKPFMVPKDWPRFRGWTGILLAVLRWLVRGGERRLQAAIGKGRLAEPS